MARSFDEVLEAQDPIRRAETLAVILGDQLDLRARLLRDLDPGRDAVLMAEVAEESRRVPSHVQRTALFLAAMRHFAKELIERGHRVRYVRLEDRRNTHRLDRELRRALDALGPRRVRLTEPGEHRIEAMVAATCRSAGVEVERLPDKSFTCSDAEFEDWATGRENLVMEHFYRARRRALGVLLDGDKPAGGKWNYDEENRRSFRGPPRVSAPYRPRSDATTRAVLALVARSLPGLPGRADGFGWPVTRRQALRALADFVERRLPLFGTYEDAMWAGEPFLYHSLLSSSLNLKLIGPRECVDAAVNAYESGAAPLNSVEGFVRQIIGWREFARGVYRREGPDYPGRNGLEQTGELPAFYWSAETEMNCLRHCLGDVLANGYGHHIPRLMVIGNFALLAGVRPHAVHEWFLGMYVDGVEWVTAPNVVGMSQHADGGVVGTKPYVASGNYIRRMSNYCRGCRFDPAKRTGDDACPFTTLYWDFLSRHRRRLRGNPRMSIALRNAGRIERRERNLIRSRADTLRRDWGVA